LLLQVLAFGGGLSATLQGGSISHTEAYCTVLVLANSTLTVQGTNLTYNKVKTGTLYSSWLSHLVVQGVVLADNAAENEGAAMYLAGSSTRVTNSTLHQNTAENAGGAIYTKSSSLRMESITLSGNSAPIGGAVAVYDNSRVDVTWSSLTNNTARIVKADLSSGNYYTLGVGGALYVEHSSVQVSHSKVLGNMAVMDGGEWGTTECWEERACHLAGLRKQGKIPLWMQLAAMRSTLETLRSSSGHMHDVCLHIMASAAACSAMCIWMLYAYTASCVACFGQNSSAAASHLLLSMQCTTLCTDAAAATVQGLCACSWVS
jgi:predicted outer membrane repeat protein